MNSVTIESTSVSKTLQVAQSIGSNLKGGECIELLSDVGGGKTTFVCGLAKGAGSTDHVSSPTFTISKVYKTPKFEIIHFDFYRLHEAGLIEHEIEEAVYDQKSVIIVEWSDIVQRVLPNDRLRIRIATTGIHSRNIKILYDSNREYVLEGL